MRHSTVVLGVATVALQLTACDRGQDIAGPAMRSPTQPAFQAIVSRTNEQDAPWTDEHGNPCNGDSVVITGTTHYLFNFAFNDDGTYHLYTRANSKGTGIGYPSLGTYKVSEDFYYTEQNPSGEQFTTSSVEQLLIFAPKPEDNYIRHTQTKITAGANGVPTATRDTAWSKCVG
jgi:hypothetical protein